MTEKGDVSSDFVCLFGFSCDREHVKGIKFSLTY